MKKKLLENKNIGSQNYGLFAFSDLHCGMGLTLGHTLKRILANNILGTAFTKIKYNDTLTNLQTNIVNFSGIRENVFEILFNVKKIVLDNLFIKNGVALLNVKGPKIVTAGDIIMPHFISIKNPNLYLFTIEDQNNISFDLFFESGFNYKLAENFTKDNWIHIDSNFCPIIKTNFNVKLKTFKTGIVGEILYFEVWTNGSITAEEAINEAFLILSNICIENLT